MAWRVEIKHKKSAVDAFAESTFRSIRDTGLNSVTGVSVTQIYNIFGNISDAQIQRMASQLLSNPLTQEYRFLENYQEPSEAKSGAAVIEIAYHPGVMDPVEASTLKGIRDLGISSVEAVKTAKQYILSGKLSASEKEMLAEKVLSNKLIQHVVDHSNHSSILKDPKSRGSGDSNHSSILKDPKSRGSLDTNPPVALPKITTTEKVDLLIVDLLKADDKQLMKISQDGQLFLNLNEMKTIQKHFQDSGQNPTDVELETIAQTWSEHCYHKTFRGDISYVDASKGKKKKKLIRSLFKTTIVRATEEINKSWCVSVFHDNAGVIKFDHEDHVCFKVETHNHPSALEPFGGANTGLGGVIRDTLGTGLGARPICSTDIFCFAPPDTALDDLPPGTLHPKRVMKGVVSGVRDYGNKMGIPTVNGAILFDRKFIGNPLVFCGNVGIMPKDKVKKKVGKGDLIVVAGGRTGRDGIHGATFSSGELTDESEVVSSGAVQIGDPIQEKKVLDAQLKARDLNLYTAVTDCGAGGLSSAVGEMGSKLGATVDLDKVPLKYQGLKYHEIWISESQERMVFSVPAQDLEQMIKIFRDEDVEACVIGEFTGSGRLQLFFKGVQVCDLDMDFMHNGTPRIAKEAVWSAPKLKTGKLSAKVDLKKILLDCLSHFNVCSKEWVVRQYDHEVQGASVVKPFVGINCDGPSDASVIAPKLGSKKGIAISNGINVRYGMIDPFWMAASCIDEAVRQIVCVGGDPDRIAILDNFCWGNPDKPDRLGALVRAAEGCYKGAVGYQVPFISGKDSLYNEFTEGKRSIAIPGTILISAIGIMEDVTKAVTMDLKEAGNAIYLVGDTKDELGGSIYLDTLGQLGNNAPQVNFKIGRKIFQALHRAIKSALVRSCHDCSEGGLAVAAAEMAFSGGLGMEIDLRKVKYSGKSKRDDVVLFSESATRLIVEVEPKNIKKFEALLKGSPAKKIGQVISGKQFKVTGLNGKVVLEADISVLKEAWQKPLRWG